MRDPTERARDDLAFVRALVSEGGQAQASLGRALVAGGLCYGLQSLVQWLFALGVAAPDWLQLAVGVLPTVIFITLLVVLMQRDKAQSQHGVATRALNAAFGGAGLAAMTTAFVFGYLSWRLGEFRIFLFHPMMVCVVQGTVWYIAFAIRRRGWLGLVSAGWFLVAVGLGLLLGTGDSALIHWFVLLIGLALLGLMALPGWILMRSARAATPD
ncbi:hypothetical protein TPR58_17210 [Sphingomonas sp. HF-S3]|uniref:DUF2157 domain-containing protein n=1 Tax=Sphingomonas rustica TaxID=3103142 RepID=A0ABV0BD06_9SPHN